MRCVFEFLLFSYIFMRVAAPRTVEHNGWVWEVGACACARARADGALGGRVAAGPVGQDMIGFRGIHGYWMG